MTTVSDIRGDDGRGCWKDKSTCEKGRTVGQIPNGLRKVTQVGMGANPYYGKPKSRFLWRPNKSKQV
jgi:hypothetical protein